MNIDRAISIATTVSVDRAVRRATQPGAGDGVSFSMLPVAINVISLDVRECLDEDLSE